MVDGLAGRHANTVTFELSMKVYNNQTGFDNLRLYKIQFESELKFHFS